MNYSNNNLEVFFLLVRAGLLGRTEGAECLQQDGVDWDEVYQLAEEQRVVGLIAEGIEIIQKKRGINFSKLAPHKWALRLVSKTLHLEQSNRDMNHFIAKLISRMQARDIYALLLKGQGVAQCYEKPLRRNCGDVDLLLNEENYRKATEFLKPFASAMEAENPYKKHLGMTIARWSVELHGSMRCGFSKRIDKELDKIQDDTFRTNNYTTWMNEEVPVFMLGKENNVLYVFVHLLNHFYKGGVGIRQICDWCRLLWTYRDSLDVRMLEVRLRNMGLMSEWKAFGMYAAEYLGMPVEVLPFYVNDEKWERKAKQIQQFILKIGHTEANSKMAHGSVSFLKRKQMSATQRFGYMVNHLTIFPLDTLRFFPSIFINGLRQK